MLVVRPGNRFKEHKQPKYNKYTSLISNRARILEEALQDDLITVTITRGFARGGASTSARKKYVKAIQSVNIVSICPRSHMPPITFRDEDFLAIDL